MGRETINLEVLSTRAGFNSAVRHINKTIEISGSLGAVNLGDLLYERGDENLSGERGALLLRMLLVDKLGYKAASSNLEAVAGNIPELAKEFESWKAVDLVAAYHHPDLGLLIANPKISGELANLGMLRKRELLVIYAGKGTAPSDALCNRAAELALALFEGSKAKAPAELLKGNFTVKKPKKLEVEKPDRKPGSRKVPLDKAAKPVKAIAATAPAVSTGLLKMTPMYSVAVTNELFHNGNVEAWKRIIDSYNAKYPELQVFIYYNGERILDINTLFKWGKVKHGSSIQFAVSGNNIKDVAKLQRYLSQGASSRFEAFLQGHVNAILRLFG